MVVRGKTEMPMDLSTPIPLGDVLVAGAIAALLALSLYGLSQRWQPSENSSLNKLKTDLGFEKLPSILFLIAALIYAAIALLLIGGLVGLIWKVISVGWPLSDKEQTEALFHILRLAGLTTVLGAVIALPITITRLRLTEKQTATTEESLFNEKINAASNDLHAQRQATRWNKKEGHYSVWEDDVTKRNSAIDRLEGLAKEYATEESDRYGAAERIARLLSVYVRELSREYKPIETPSDATPDELRAWAEKLKPARPDMEKAVQTLRRIRPLVAQDQVYSAIDLTDANLQGFRLNGGDLSNANFSGAHMQGVRLSETNLDKADLRGAKLQGAVLNLAKLQGAVLNLAKLQGADLTEAKLQGADLRGAKFDASTAFTVATLRGATVKAVDFIGVSQIEPHLDDIFGDASVTLPNGARPGDPGWPVHWSQSDEPLDYHEFDKAWRAWQATLPEGWDQPDV